MPNSVYTPVYSMSGISFKFFYFSKSNQYYFSGLFLDNNGLIGSK